MITKNVDFNPIKHAALLAFLMASNEIVLAEQAETCCVANQAPAERRAFLKIISGASFSQKADISADNTYWARCEPLFHKVRGLLAKTFLKLTYNAGD